VAALAKKREYFKVSSSTIPSRVKVVYSKVFIPQKDEVIDSHDIGMQKTLCKPPVEGIEVHLDVLEKGLRKLAHDNEHGV
jgi:hypothetical protein